jgi:1,4-alpha-glucan branching enzyme
MARVPHLKGIKDRHPMREKSDMSILEYPSKEEMRQLVSGDHSDPHRILGAHPLEAPHNTFVVIRAFHPDAKTAEILFDDGQPVPMRLVHPGGLFAASIPARPFPFLYRLRFGFHDGKSWEGIDPYRFLPTLGEVDLYLIGEGTHQRLYNYLGAHGRTIDGVQGTSFAVWAPNAQRVSLLGPFNRWDGRINPMRSLGTSGIWELFVPGVTDGTSYKFEIKAADGSLRIKTDPYAFSMELRPGTASIVHNLDRYPWTDEGWMKARPMRNPREEPMAIYEVHLGSWKRVPEEGNRWLTYRELAPQLVEHVKKFGFTHIELLPVAEHPFDASWGYQVSGYFAPTSRFGSPDDFKYLVDFCHQNGIGVILDWVPSHFPKDDYSLRWFDGTALYEHADPRKGEHKDWGTLIFNYGRNEVKNFLLANAVFWLDQYHIDALRVDAVASMLYLDYSRNEGEWIPNRYGGRENLEAVAFIRQLNETLYRLFPGCFTIAEESTAWGGVTLPTYLGGLGFGFKWNMGWMHDTLLYFSKDPIHRSFHHNQVTFSMLYEYTENFIVPLSHDEVVHGKGSLLGKMPGDEWQKFANLRLLLGYMYTHPGKKLLFMGTELASPNEWYHDTSLDWHLEADPMRQGLQQFITDLGNLYRDNSALWEWDHVPKGFFWIDCNDWEGSVFSFVRNSRDRHLICVMNCTPVPRYGYRLGVPERGVYLERINSDSCLYGGSNLGNGGRIEAEPIPCHGFSQSVSMTLPPLACLILEPSS